MLVLVLLLSASAMLPVAASKRTDPRKYYTLSEAANWLQLSPDSVRRAISRGHLRGFRLPGSRLLYVKLADLETFVESGELPNARPRKPSNGSTP